MPLKKRKAPSTTILGVRTIAALMMNPLNARNHNSAEVERLIEHHETFELPFHIMVDENNVILTGYDKFVAAQRLGLESLVSSTSSVPMSLSDKKRHLTGDGHAAVAKMIEQ